MNNKAAKNDDTDDLKYLCDKYLTLETEIVQLQKDIQQKLDKLGLSRLLSLNVFSS